MHDVKKKIATKTCILKAINMNIDILSKQITVLLSV